MENLEEGRELLAPVFRKRQTNFQPNLFTESRQEFSELEKKIVTLVVNQVGHLSIKNQILRGSDLIINIPFAEINKTHYTQIADAAESLQSKRLIYRHDKSQQLDIITPFPRIRFDVINDLRVIELTMFSAVVPHFAELGKRYTKYDIDVMLSLSSVYSQRMFEIVSMYHNRGQTQFTYKVDRLMEILNCPDQYNFNDFRKNSLVIAQRELDKKAGINLDWLPHKEGKKIVELTFVIKTAQQIAAEGVRAEQLIAQKWTIAEAMAEAHKLMRSYNLKGWQKDLILFDPNLLEIFIRVDSELANGLRINVKNPTAYLVKSLGIDQHKAPPKTAQGKPKPNSKPAPQPTLSFDSTERTATTQSMASILGSMIMNGQ